MKLLLPLVVLLIIAKHAYADLLFIGTSPRGNIFIDDASLEKVKNDVTFQSILNLTEKTSRGTSSLKIKSTINCRKLEIVDINILSYEEADGNGRIIDSWKPELKWRAIEANNLLYKFVCNR
jgi:hypothetical protein